MPNSNDDKLLREANKVSYRLRSTFFLRKLKEYNTLAFPKQVETLIPVSDSYNWDERASWGIGEDAFDFIEHSDLESIQVFCHPKLLREHPELVAYYRNVAALSQKSVQRLISKNVKPYESDEEDIRPLSSGDAQAFATLFNEHITLIVDSSVRSFNASQLQGLLLASTGAQIDGSWRNAIGDEAEKVVQRLLVKEAVERELLRALIRRDTGATEELSPHIAEEQLDNIRDYRGFLLVNQTCVLFSSEPDISLIGRDGSNVGVIEVKGGTDPAGALERLGAAKKSFEESLRDDEDTETILVASCLTPEVHTRIKSDSTIDEYYNLTELLSDNTEYDRFVQQVFGLLE